MAKKKGSAATDDDSKQGTSRHAHHHDIVTHYDGEGSWSVKVYFGDLLRHTITGLRYEGDAYWAGDDWACLNRLLVPDTKVAGKDYAPVVFENGVELVRLPTRSHAGEALEYAEQYVEQMRVADRERVARKQELRAEYILKVREFDMVEAGIEKKIADLKEALKLAEQRREEWIESVRNPQVSFNFVFDRKKAKQADIEDATNPLAGLGAPPKPDQGPRTPPKKDRGDDATGGPAHP